MNNYNKFWGDILLYYPVSILEENIKNDFNDNLSLNNILEKYSSIQINNDCNKLILILKDIKKNSNLLDITLDIKAPFFKLCYDKNNNPIVIVSKINNNNITIYGIDGEGALSDYTIIENYMVLNCTNRCSCSFIEVNSIKINKYLRSGRGSLLLKYLEKNLVSYFNKVNYNKILKIQGSIGKIGELDITNEDRIKFYKSNNYKIKGLNFYKNL